MDRSFVIAHISDLHLDGSGRLLATIEALGAAIREKMADFADIPDRILLITGDLVNDPTPRALDEALAVIASVPADRPVHRYPGDRRQPRCQAAEPARRPPRCLRLSASAANLEERLLPPGRPGSGAAGFQQREPHGARERHYRSERLQCHGRRFRPAQRRARRQPWLVRTRRLRRAGGKSGARAGDAPSSAAAGNRRREAVSRRPGRAADVSRRARDLSSRRPLRSTSIWFCTGTGTSRD